MPLGLLLSSLIVPSSDHPPSLPNHLLVSSMVLFLRWDLVFLRHSFDHVIPQIKTHMFLCCLKHVIQITDQGLHGCSEPGPLVHTHTPSHTYTYKLTLSHTQSQHILSHTYTCTTLIACMHTPHPTWIPWQVQPSFLVWQMLPTPLPREVHSSFRIHPRSDTHSEIPFPQEAVLP